MGRGDRKTRKGKIAIRSYGNVRPHADSTAVTAKPKSATKSAAKPAAKVRGHWQPTRRAQQTLLRQPSPP